MGVAKTIRIWHGCKVVLLLSVSESGYSTMGAAGGAGNSTQVDIEIDPWAGLLVENGAGNSPVPYRDVV